MTILKKARDTGRWASLAAGVALVSLLAAAPAPAAAESVNDVIRSLAPIAGQPRPDRPYKPSNPVPYYPDPSGPGDRSGPPGPDDPSGPPTITIDDNYTYDLVVYFPLDSADLTGYARSQLYALGTALRSPALLPYRYLIAGHTDATGLPEYNRDLSIRRAYAVTHYLVERYGINPRRLLNTGWGATRLKDPRNPYSGVNRRVEVALVVDQDMPPPAVSDPGPVIIPPPPRGTYSDEPPPPRRGYYSDAPPPPRRGNYSDAPPPPRRGNYSDAPPPPPRRGNYLDAPPPPPPRDTYSDAPPPPRRGPPPPPPPRGTYSDAPPPPPRGTYSDAPPPPPRDSDAPPPPPRDSDAPPPPRRGTYRDAPPPPPRGPEPVVVEPPAPPAPPPAATVPPGGRIIINSQ